MKTVWTTILLMLFLSGAVTAAPVGATPPPASNATIPGIDPDLILNQVKARYHNGTDLSFAPAAPPAKLDDPDTRARYLRAWNAYYDYLAEGLEYRMRVFRWQHLSTRIIFFTVLALVASGIVFSGLQFWRTLRLDRERGPAQDPVTEFEASAKGIKVSSPVLGVIILVISLAFFYLYLVHVYPIVETF